MTRTIKGRLLMSRRSKKLPPRTIAYIWLVSMINEARVNMTIRYADKHRRLWRTRKKGRRGREGGKERKSENVKKRSHIRSSQEDGTAKKMMEYLW